VQGVALVLPKRLTYCRDALLKHLLAWAFGVLEFALQFI
jgi:hypothetical protein